MSASKIILLILAILLVIFLLRVGAHIPAGIISLIIAFSPLINKVILGRMGAEKSQQSSNNRTSGVMARKEALDILGIKTDNPTSSEIKAAYKKLISKIHPDQGGSEYLATKLNEAKEVLLNDKK